MGIGIKLLGGGGGGGGRGILKVPDAAGLAALVPAEGDFAIQLDTDTLYYYNGVAWEIYLDDSSYDDLLTVIAGLAAHLADTTDAHDASAVSFAPAGAIVATDVQAAIVEAAADAAADLAAHLADTVDAHDASAISFAPAGNIAATDVQAAIAELDSETDARLDALEATTHAAVTLAAFGATPNANGLTLTGQVLNMQPASSTQPGGVSTAQQDFGGAKSFTAVKVGATGAPTTSTLVDVQSTTLFSRPLPSMTTAQRNAIASPGVGMALYNTDTKQPEIYNGSLFERILSNYMNSTATISASGNITPADSRRQVLPIVGNAAPVSAADIVVTNALAGDELTLIGTSDTNTVTVVSATNTVLNGSYTMLDGYTLTLVFYGTKWYEKARSH